MHAAKEKLSNTASAAKEHVDSSKAKLEGKAEQMSARTKEEKEIAEEQRKAKGAEAKMEKHGAKAEHKADRLNADRAHHIYGHHDPLVTTQGHYPMGTDAPATTRGMAQTDHPITGIPPAEKYL